MEILIYNELDASRVQTQFDRVVERLRNNDFRSAEVKKLLPTDYYRAKLNDSDRLLFQFAEYQGKRFLLLLEVIYRHGYDKSRFLNGAAVDESELEPLDSPEKTQVNTPCRLNYLNTSYPHFNILDKIISFDDIQKDTYHLRPPIILIGSAGSGKTMLTLEKLKQLQGDILYVTRSPYLAENARNLYFSFNYENEGQNIDFLSFKEYLESIHIPEGRPMTFYDFEKWFSRYSFSSKIRDTHKLFEEFNGVLTGADIHNSCMPREDYLSLGVKRSIFTGEERPPVYEIFVKYLESLKAGGFYDLNIEASKSLHFCHPSYDFVVVDEVQDLTNIQLHLILKSLRTSEHFILCGDSNQIVHPNFFSWTNIKTMFYEERTRKHLDIIRILNTNYRNSRQITEIANRLLLVKNARFGSIDRESNYLVKCNSDIAGKVELLAESDRTKGELDSKTRQSAKYAVLVMRQEDKADARRFFHTPLLFSIQEAKGLEYENIIMYNFVSGNQAEFNEIIEGVSAEELSAELRYARAKDKTDKALEVFKFHINALYVAITRSIRNIHIVEKNTGHRLFSLLSIAQSAEMSKLSEQKSSSEEWKAEARRLEMQGKKNQADEIRRNILKIQPVPWTILTPESLANLEKEAFNPNHFNKQAKQLIYEYAVEYGVPHIFDKLLELKFNKAAAPLRDAEAVLLKYVQICMEKGHGTLNARISQYGVDFRNQLNQTPLMIAAKIGNAELAAFLVKNGANTRLRDNWGRTPLQIALREAFLSKAFAQYKMAGIYSLLSPPSMNVKIEDRLIKIDARTMEFFLLNSMLSFYQDIMRRKIQFNTPAFESGDFFFPLEHFSGHVIPEHRRKRSYISSILSKNEYFRDGSGNRQIFYRVRQGFYIPHPHMEIEVEEDNWINVFDLINISFLEKETKNSHLAAMLRFIRHLQKVKFSELVRKAPEQPQPRPQPRQA
jgi:hypothetical protein